MPAPYVAPWRLMLNRVTARQKTSAISKVLKRKPPTPETPDVPVETWPENGDVQQVWGLNGASLKFLLG